MQKVLFAMTVTLAACGGGNMTTDVDANVDGVAATCTLPMTETDAGSETAVTAQRCNVPGSMGSMHWYRMFAAMPSGAMDFVQLELWPNLGAFAGTTVADGTYTISGADADPTTCGVCVRAVGHHGGTDQMDFFATAGTVVVSSFGDAPTAMTATITNAKFIEVDANNAPVAGGCDSMLPNVAMSGPTINEGGTGTGGGGGTGTGGGGGACKRTIGDI